MVRKDFLRRNPNYLEQDNYRVRRGNELEKKILVRKSNCGKNAEAATLDCHDKVSGGSFERTGLLGACLSLFYCFQWRSLVMVAPQPLSTHYTKFLASNGRCILHRALPREGPLTRWRGHKQTAIREEHRQQMQLALY